MHPRLTAIRDELLEAQRRLHALAAAVPDDAWARRPAPEGWSPAECVAHLVLTASGYEPGVVQALEEGRRLRAAGVAPGRYRRDPVGWLMWRVLAPPVRLRVKTTARFVPMTVSDKAQTVAEFDRWQAVQLDWVAAADGLPLSRLMIRSPFDPRLRYNLYACLSLLPRHQARHLWQAERAWAARGGDRG